jgi:hypothetical protein
MAKQKRQSKSAMPDTVGKPVIGQPTQAEIARRAHEIHVARGGVHGCDLDDWLQAERELQAGCTDAPPAGDGGTTS